MTSDFWAKFYPHTATIGFIKTNTEILFQSYSEWINNLYMDDVVSVDSGSIEYAFCNLKPLQAPRNKIIFIETKSEWIAYFDNGTYGPDPFPPVTVMSEALECEALIAGFSEHTLKRNIGRDKGTYGSVKFIYYSPESDDFFHCQRVIQAAYDGGRWIFINEGDPFPFEDTSRYLEKRTIDRFDREMLERYCKSMGIELFNEEFYGGQFMLACLPIKAQ